MSSHLVTCHPLPPSLPHPLFVQLLIKPLVVSHGSGSGFVSDFIWDGCRDYAPFLGERARAERQGHHMMRPRGRGIICEAERQGHHMLLDAAPVIAHPSLASATGIHHTHTGVSSALAMWRALGPERCLDGCRALLAEAVLLLTGSWRTRTLAPLSMCANMALVALPGDRGGG